MKCKIGIRPTIDARSGVRQGLERQTMLMAQGAKRLIEQSLRYSDSEPVEVIISPCTIGGGAEAARCAEYFSRENVCATLTVTPCWCYGSETMDLDPYTVKAVWGFNGTERPGAVYLAAAMAAHAQRGLPAFSIYGRDVQDADDTVIPEDVKDRILRFARCAIAVGQMKNRSYTAIGGVSMGIAGSFLDPNVMQDYLGLRAEWVDMVEIIRRERLGIYDKEEYQRAILWAKSRLRIGKDYNPEWGNKAFTEEEKNHQLEFAIKMTVIIRDILQGNEALKGEYPEEAQGKNAIAGGFQGQRQWTDFLPNGDLTEAIMNSSFDWNGKREPFILATENDSLNAIGMLFGKLLTGRASVFADVRTYWSPDAVKRATGWTPDGRAQGGFIHLLNSGAAALDGSGACKGASGSVMKPWWEVEQGDIDAMLEAVSWYPANRGYFRGGGFSSGFSSSGEMPATMVRLNYIKGVGLTMQIAQGHTVDIRRDVSDALLKRTDPTWPSTWFVPELTGGAFSDVYSVMANWGANHCALIYGHVGQDMITLASMLRIPVVMHNVKGPLMRPHSWNQFSACPDAADRMACDYYGPLYK